VHDPLIEMVQLPGGTFRMGSDKARDPQADDNECPSREVRLSPFAMALTPITRGLYRSLVKDAPFGWRGDKDDAALPANYVRWDDALRFCNALSERSGLKPCYRQTDSHWADSPWACDWAADGYRLPTEAEWEYACRAGTETPWFWGPDDKKARRYAWFVEDWSTGSVHPVAQKLVNPWGLRDMAGNCWEWCWDRYASPYDPSATDDPRGPAVGQWRVLRGGSFGSEPRDLRSAARARNAPGSRLRYVGFRCVRGSGRQPLP
jgi:formylglycine-generating enzyme required for sulfatase activity